MRVKVKIDMNYVGWGGSSINWNTVDHIEKVHEVKATLKIMMMFGFGLN